ncbi:Uro-adherence factor A [Paragonimus heterotremus]|uniref:Uro-adherence factor A n=1 Tax=Paragonimus heterotremus TaxID=100268 RepID=A0A8J4WLB8_9TREM|nr:Uro-adherence factor A [Paragonimus heterotremus]
MSSLPYSYSSTPIMEGWLIKALRLAHSKRPTDQERLRKLYRDACESDVQVSRITVAEALRELKDPIRSEPLESDSVAANPSRIRPAPSFSGSQSSAVSQPRNTVTESSASDLDAAANQSGNLVAVTPTQQASSLGSTAGGKQKRSKVTFFNMFDRVGSTGPVRSNTQSSMTRTEAMTAARDSLVLDLTESPTSGTSLTSVAAGITSSASTPITVALSAPTVVNLSVTESVTLASVTESLPICSSAGALTNAGSSNSDAGACLVASLVADLSCCICGKLTRQPQLEADGKTMNANMLVECVQCGALYHQMCHQPPISSASQPINPQEWRCGKCVFVPMLNSNIVVSASVSSTTSATVAIISDDPPVGNVEVSATSVNANTGARRRKGALLGVFATGGSSTRKF